MRVIAVVPSVVGKVEHFAHVVAAVKTTTVVCDAVELVLGGRALTWMG